MAITHVRLNGGLRCAVPPCSRHSFLCGIERRNYTQAKGKSIMIWSFAVAQLRLGCRALKSAEGSLCCLYFCLPKKRNI